MNAYKFLTMIGKKKNYNYAKKARSYNATDLAVICQPMIVPVQHRYLEIACKSNAV